MDSKATDPENLLLRSQARQFALLDRVDYRVAETNEDKNAIYRLRYRAYLKEGAVEPNASQTVTDRFDNLPNSWIVGVFLDNVLVSSVRVSVSLPDHPETPSLDVFPDQVAPLLAAGKIIIDPTRFVVDPTYSNRLRELPYVTLRAGWLGAGYFKADVGLASVRAEHCGFYLRKFRQEKLAEARTYPGLIKPICLLAGDYPAMCNEIMQDIPIFRSTHFERRKLFERRSDSQSARRKESQSHRVDVVALQGHWDQSHAKLYD